MLEGITLSVCPPIRMSCKINPSLMARLILMKLSQLKYTTWVLAWSIVSRWNIHQTLVNSLHGLLNC